MAQRNLTNIREVTSVAAKNPNLMLEATAQIGQQIMRQSEEAKINESLSQAQLELNSMQNQYQIDFEADPMGGSDEYKSDRKAMFDRFGENISPLYRGVWNENVRKLSRQNDATQQAWALKQTRINTVRSINSSMKNSFVQANMDGQTFAKDESAEISAYLNYENSKQKLQQWGDRNLGEGTTTKMLANYERDYLKSFVSGVADTNPQKAATLLESDQIKDRFTSDELKTMENVVRKNAKKLSVQTLFVQAENENKVADLVSTSEGDYYSKRLQIDTMELNREISKETAAQARRVLTSQKNVDNVTSSDTMARLVTQMYDLNVIADRNSKDYLIGVRNVRNSILKDLDAGNLRPEDAQKLNGQLRTLTAARTASATRRVGNSFHDANKRFNDLPPQYRGEATRQLFYKTYGRNDVTKQQYNAMADGIIDEMRLQIRNQAFEKTREIAVKDTTFVEGLVNPKTGKNVTMQDIKAAAENRGISEQEVINLLRGTQ